MLISTQLKVIATGTIVTIVILLSVLFWSFSEFKSAKEDYVLANMILDNFFERASLRDQYFLYHENRVWVQWNHNKEISDRLIKQAEVQFRHQDDHALVEQLHKDIDETSVIFHRIVNNVETSGRAPDKLAIFEELDTRLSSQLLLKAAAVRDSANALKDSSAQRVESTYANLTLYIGLLTFTLALTTLLTTLHLGNLFRRRLTTLHEGAQWIADGHLDFQIKSEGSDEFSALAHSFNSMTNRLHEEILTQRRMGIELEESEARFRSIIEASPVSCALNDEQQNIIYLNEAFIKTFGYTHEDIPTLPDWWNKAYPDAAYRQLIATSWQNHLEKSLKEKAPFQPLEVNVCCKDGRYRTTVVSATPIGLAFNGIHLVTLIDITERNRIAQDLLRENEKNRALLRNASDGIHILDPEGNVIEASDSFCTMLGYSRDEVIGMNVSRWDAGFTSAAEIANLLRQQFGNPNRSQFETQHRRKDGSVFDVEVSGYALELEGKPALFNSSRDISERKRAEKALYESEARLRVMLENDLVGIVTVKDRIIQWANPAFEKMLGYERGELNGTPTRLNYLSEEEYLALGAKAYPDITAGKVFHTEISHRRKDGSIIHVDLSGALLSPESGESLWGFVDITDRIESELELKRSNFELEQFSYAISHDMRQPLRMITSYLQLIEINLAEKLDSTNQEYFNFASEGAKRLDQMLVGLLDYSRVGRKNVPFEWVESRTLLDEAILFLGPTIAEAQATLEIEGQWPHVLVNPDEIERLLQNLIGNAVKYRVAEIAPQIHVVSTVYKGKWHVRVKDNGIGIDPTQIGRLFQVFQRLQSRANYEGNGVGLALCRRIVEHHGGRIWAESSGEHQGSTFSFEIALEHKR